MQSLDPIAVAIAVAIIASQVAAFIVAIRAASRTANLFRTQPTIVERNADDGEGQLADARGFQFRLQLPSPSDRESSEFAIRCNQALEGLSDLGEQLRVCRNAADRLAMRYERRAAVFASAPMYLGLVGTFAGIINGLVGLSIRTGFSEASIQAFLAGVFVAMAASLVGVSLMVVANTLILPRASLACEGHLADYLSALESRVRRKTKDWAERSSVTGHRLTDPMETIAVLAGTLESFSGSFSTDVTILRDAVKELTDSIEPQRAILKAVQKLDLTAAAKANASLVQGVDTLTQRFATFDESLGSLVAALNGSKDLMSSVTSIMNRVTRFEQSIEGLGEKIAADNTVTANVVELVRRQLGAIQDRTDVLQQYVNQQDDRITTFAAQHREKVENLATKASQTLEDVGDRLVFELERSADPTKIARLLQNVDALPGILDESKRAGANNDLIARELGQLNATLGQVTRRLDLAVRALDKLDQNSVTSILRRWTTGIGRTGTES